MIEILFSCATLMNVGLMSKIEYNDPLDKMFLETPDNELLIELEFASSDMNKTISIIKSSCDILNMDHIIFGELLMDGREKMYSKLILEDMFINK